MILVLPVLLVSCATDGGVLDVNTFHLRDTDDELIGSGFMRAEQRRALYGAVTKVEREARLGQYYSVAWDVAELGRPAGEGATELVFLFRQAATASKVLVKRVDYGAGVERGVANFDIVADEYLRGGRVLMWRVELRRGGEVLGSRQSYMWE